MTTTKEQPQRATSPGKKGASRIIVLKSHAQAMAEGGEPKSMKLNSIDYVAMNGLNGAFGSKIDIDLLNVCGQRHLLPLRTLHALNNTAFLCLWMIPAKVAENASGIRVSILLAEAWFADSPPLSRQLNNCFAVPHGVFDSLEECLLDHALRLRKNPKFDGVMCAMKDSDECLRQLGICELWDKQGREDRVDFILEGDWQDCDFAGSEPTLDGGKTA
jgi:hypothetical protein